MLDTLPLREEPICDECEIAFPDTTYVGDPLGSTA
jgi:hypothetical protein